MINLKISKNEDVIGFYNFEIVVDTGTSVTAVNPGIMQREDLIDILIDVEEQVSKLIDKYN